MRSLAVTEFAPGRWRGQWIWSQRTAHRPSENPFDVGLDPDYYDRRVMFRRTFDLAEVPPQAPFRITADSRYILYVNGIEVSRGPVRHGPRQLHYDHGDIAAALRPGHNVIAVQARFFGRANAWWMPSPVTLTLGGGSVVGEFRLGDQWITTDDSWRTHDATAWTPSLPVDVVAAQLVEVFDANRLDPGWTGPDFDDSQWPAARPLADLSHGAGGDARPPSEPFGAILPSPLPPPEPNARPAQTITVGPASWTPPEPTGITAALATAVETPPSEELTELDLSAGPRLLIADFGQIVAGNLRLQLTVSGDVTIDGALTELTTAG